MSIITILPSGQNVTISSSGLDNAITVTQTGVSISTVTINQGQQGPAGASIQYVQNIGNNRVLTSDGSITGIYAESNLLFDGSQLSVGGTTVSLSGHTHTSSDITNFNSAVSGLIPPPNFTSLSGTSGITVTNTGTNYYVALTDPTIQLTDITDLPSDSRTFLLTPSSSNFQTLITNETGSGVVVFNNSPVFSGTPTVPTANSGTNTNQIASTAFVRTEISNLIDSAPSTLDTLNELAQALGDDPNFATTISNSLANKVSKSGDTMTGALNAPSGLFTNYLSLSGIPVSVSGHYHISNDITNFDSSVSGLLPSVTGTGYIISSFYNNIYTIDVSGLQPSGNYASGIHTHTTSDIIGISGYVYSGVNLYLTQLSNIGNNCDIKYIVIQDISNNTKLVSISGIAEAISVIDGGGVLYSGC